MPIFIANLIGMWKLNIDLVSMLALYKYLHSHDFFMKKTFKIVNVHILLLSQLLNDFLQ